MRSFFAVLLFVLPALAAAQVRLLDIPQPDLSAMQAPVRQRVQALEATIENLRRSPGSDNARELSLAYGQLGQHYHAFELLDAALIAYQNAQSMAPNDGRWSYYVGLVQHMRGEIEEEASSYQRILKLGSEPTVELRLARALLELDRGEEAKPLFERLLTTESFRAAAHFGLGKIAAERADFAAAVEHFETALELQPEASMIHYPLGQAYRRMDDLDKAKQHLAQRGRDDVRFPDPLGSEVAWLAAGTAFDVVQALAASAENFSDRDFLGFALSQLGDVDGAIDSLENALRFRQKEPDAPDAVESARIHYALGGLLVHRKSDDRAVEHFRFAVGLDPSLLDAHIKLGNVLARQEQFTDAVAQYSRVLERDPRHGGALLKRAAAQMQAGAMDSAAADLEKLLEIEPTNTEAHSRLAAIHQEKGNLPRAIELFTAAAKLDLTPREGVLIHTQIGHLLRLTGNFASAAEHYQTALEINPEIPETRFYLANVLGSLGRFQESAENYRQVVVFDPQHGGARTGEVTALTLLGQHKAARERLVEGLVAMPDDVTLKHILARHLATCPERSLRDGEKALALAQVAFQAEQSFEHAATVAMALAELGRFEQAVEWQQALLGEARGGASPEEVALLERHLALFESGQSCCGS